MTRPHTLGWSVSARIGFYTGPRTEAGCREWMAALAGGRGRDYAILRHKGRNQNVTRIILGLGPGDPRVAMHTCDNRSCVEPSHLRIGTRDENMADMVRKGRTRPCRGEASGQAKLRADDVSAIKAMRRAGETYMGIAAKFGVHHEHVRQICLGQKWASHCDTAEDDWMGRKAGVIKDKVQM